MSLIFWTAAAAFAHALPPPLPDVVDCHDGKRNTTTVLDGENYICSYPGGLCDCGVCSKVADVNTSRADDKYCVILTQNVSDTLVAGFICPALTIEYVSTCKDEQFRWQLFFILGALPVLCFMLVTAGLHIYKRTGYTAV